MRLGSRHPRLIKPRVRDSTDDELEVGEKRVVKREKVYTHIHTRRRMNLNFMRRVSRVFHRSVSIFRTLGASTSREENATTSPRRITKYTNASTHTDCYTHARARISRMRISLNVNIILGHRQDTQISHTREHDTSAMRRDRAERQNAGA